MFAPSAGRWAAYMHCKIAEVSLAKDCGCDTIITAYIPAEKNHAAPLQLVQHLFADWQFEKAKAIRFSFLKQLPLTSFNLPTPARLPADRVQSIFHPPGA